MCQAFIRAVRAFTKAGALRSAQQWLQLLGLMAATISLVYEARMRIRPVQMCLKSKGKQIRQSGLKVTSTCTNIQPDTTPAVVDCHRASSGRDATQSTSPRVDCDNKLIHQDGLGRSHNSPQQAGGALQRRLVKTSEKEHLHKHSRVESNTSHSPEITVSCEGKIVRCECDNTTAIAYLNRQGLRELCQEALDLWE